MQQTHLLAILVALLFVGAAAENKVSVDSVFACHNYTGTCLQHGFVCANGQVVKHGQRCDNFEDCLDGTDEYRCDEDPRPYSTYTEDERRMREQQDSSCAGCGCAVNVATINEFDPWFQYAKVAPTDSLGLMTGSGPYANMPCNPRCVINILMAFYKKSNVCRGALCCMRQRECISCHAACGAFSPDFMRRCYA